MKSLNDFSAIYVINLATRADRRAEVAEQLAQVGLSFSSPNVNLFEAVRPNDAGGFDSVGARGCFMSHLGVLRLAKSSDNVVIIEDDLDFVQGIGDKLGSTLSALPENWGIFYGGCFTNLVASTSPVTLAPPHTLIQNAHFVAFNGSVIGPLINYLEAILTRPSGHVDGGPMHVDGAYARFRLDNPKIIAYLAIPELGYQRPSRTDIHSLKWYDTLPVVKQVAQYIRRQRYIIKRGI